MPLLAQFFQALVVSPLIIVKGKASFFVALLVYVVLGLIVFGGFSYLLIENQEHIRQALMDYLLPESWHSISDRLIHFFFESQTKTVLASMIISGSMVVASVILFPVKEYCSALFEKESGYSNGAVKEFPLWLQAIEECKLLVLYITVQSIIFGIGYYPYPWCSWVSNTLSVVFLCFSFGLDFISPTLQRHRIRYTSIIKLLLKNPIVTMVFGAVFSIPVLLLGQWILRIESLNLAEMAAILFVINLFFLAIAIPAGTHISSKLMPYAQALIAPSVYTKKIAYSVMILLLVLGVSFHALVAMSMHHKSQFLKCKYDIDFSSIDVQMPSLLGVALGGKEVALSFDLQVYNPTKFDLDIEESYLNIWQNENLISRILITELNVKSGQTVNRPMTFKMQFNTQMLTGFKDLLQGWTVQMEYELLPGLPFVVQIL